ncbi:Cof-type HAD-IIB family hydrolase [Streptococcus oricebi]|uniref:Hydrolase n=1 Tax=Streptococcus oricebi TaxID=1547447 RepID=A0ABS5B3G3_9STRE|nr:Cof-type HAD-IIB family hydrolase [Streptococcus oricebi]MBP2623051.1 hydrolase [Streptococcus oricebi]
MDIKVIATDMDGTFLNSKNDYQRQRFAQLFVRLKDKQIKFVPISGNQYYQIRSFFPQLDEQMTIVGENGAYIVEEGRFIKSYRLPLKLVRIILDYLISHGLEREMILCGERASYILKDVQPKARDFFAIYCQRLEDVASFDQLPQDHFLKFSFNTPLDITQKVIDDLHQVLGQEIEAVTTGHGNIDIIARGTHKGRALSYLLKRWGYGPQNLMAFGDSNNDLQMLELADYSYAMANADPAALATAKFQTASNDQAGVLEAIEAYLDRLEKDKS